MDNKQEIKQIFETMEYKNITEDLSLAQVPSKHFNSNKSVAVNPYLISDL